MNSRSKQVLFFVAYVYVLFQLFAMLMTTLAVIQLGAPSVVKSAAMFGTFFLGVVTLIVMILRPTLERELLDEPQQRPGSFVSGHGFSRAASGQKRSGI
jgi:hypothetical protein